MKAHKRFSLLTSGALAAAIALAFWIGLGGAARVSAASILDGFQTAVRKTLSIRMEGIDLGSVTIDGEIVLDHSPEGPENDTLYAEVHVLLKADDASWDDLDAAIVICNTPDDSWHYCRGYGGIIGLSHELGARHAQPAEYLVKGEAWSDFVERPLDSFGCMPLEQRFSLGSDAVTYRFQKHQRDYVEQLLRFLVDIGGAEGAGQLIEQLQSAGSIVVKRFDAGYWVLQASNFGRIEGLGPTDPQLPDDLNSLLEEIVWEITYDLTDRRIRGWSTNNWPEGLTELAIDVDHHLIGTNLPSESAEALIEHLEDFAHAVEVEQESETILTIRATGYSLPFDSTAREWQDQRMQPPIDAMTLSIYYDARTESVTWAEFNHVGSSEGRIMLEIGRVELDPDLLNPDYWITEHTEVYEEPEGR